MELKRVLFDQILHKSSCKFGKRSVHLYNKLELESWRKFAVAKRKPQKWNDPNGCVL